MAQLKDTLISGDLRVTGDVNASSLSGEISTENITSGVLPIERGGTNASTAANARKNLFNKNLASDGEYLIATTNNWNEGGYIAKSNALSWIGAAASSHTHSVQTTSIGSASAGTAIAADDITAWSAGSLPTASVADGVLTFTMGSLPSLSYTARSIPNISVTNKTVATGITAN